MVINLLRGISLYYKFAAEIWTNVLPQFELKYSIKQNNNEIKYNKINKSFKDKIEKQFVLLKKSNFEYQFIHCPFPQISQPLCVLAVILRASPHIPISVD